MKIIINVCHGGFELSQKAFEYLIKLGWRVTDRWEDKISNILDTGEFQKSIAGRYRFLNLSEIDIRTNPDIIAVVETLGEESYGDCASLKIIDIPDDIEYEIQDYDGMEWIAEKHRTWH